MLVFEAYKIFFLDRIKDEKFGEYLIVKANPFDVGNNIFDAPLLQEKEHTHVFFIPMDLFEEELSNYLGDGDYWTPEDRNYIMEYDVYEGSSRPTFRHIAFYRNEPFLKFDVLGCCLPEEREIQMIKEEHWAFKKDCIITPYNNLHINGLFDWEEIDGEDGISLYTEGCLRLSNVRFEKNPFISSIPIKAVELSRQPHNSFVVARLFDESDCHVLTMFGLDHIDDNNQFLLQNYQDKMGLVY